MTQRSLKEQRTLALAGVAQAARIVDVAAKTGSWPTPFAEASIHSLFCFEPDAVDTVLAHHRAFGWVLSSSPPAYNCHRIRQLPTPFGTPWRSYSLKNVLRGERTCRL